LHTATFAQRRELVELLIDRVVVTGEEVEIRYVLPTSPTSEQTRFCQLRLDYFGHTLPKGGHKKLLCDGECAASSHSMLSQSGTQIGSVSGEVLNGGGLKGPATAYREAV
jgi:hypothetical protein